MFSATERAKPRQRSRITTGSTATWLWFADLRVTVAEKGVYNKKLCELTGSTEPEPERELAPMHSHHSILWL